MAQPLPTEESTLQTPSVDVLARQPQDSHTSLPVPMRRWALARGWRLSWQSKSQENLSLAFGQGIAPVTREMLEQARSEDGKQSLLEALDANPMNRLFFTAEGYIQKFDSVLCYQAQAHHDHYQQIIDRRRAIRESGTGHIEAFASDIEGDIRRTGHSSLPDLVAGAVVPDARDVVSVSKKPKE